MANLETIKDRIRKLLRLGTNHAAAEGEVKNALRFAQQLMDEYHLTKADIEQDEAALCAERMIRASVYSNGSKLSEWEGIIAGAVAKAVGTVGCYRSSPTIRRNEMGIVNISSGGVRQAVALTFYGPDEDVQIAIEIFQEITMTIIAMARLKYGGAFRGEGRSYCEGFAAELLDQAGQGEQARSTACTEIVRQSAERAMKWLQEECGIRLSSRCLRSSGSHDAEAYREGRADGSRTRIRVKRKARLGAGPKVLPGN